PPRENGQPSHLLTSVLILILVFIILIILAGYFFRFRRHRKAVVNSTDKKMPNGILEEQVELLEDEIRIRAADDGKLFREEFNSLPPGYLQGSLEMANKEENREKNRYPNILP
ncbi:hypothetical protein Chor_013949, partial [Crotalus horridus]